MSVEKTHNAMADSLARLFTSILREGFTLARFSTADKKTFIKTVEVEQHDLFIEYKIIVSSQVGEKQN